MKANRNCLYFQGCNLPPSFGHTVVQYRLLILTVLFQTSTNLHNLVNRCKDLDAIHAIDAIDLVDIIVRRVEESMRELLNLYLHSLSTLQQITVKHSYFRMLSYKLKVNFINNFTVI